MQKNLIDYYMPYFQTMLFRKTPWLVDFYNFMLFMGSKVILLFKRFFKKLRFVYIQVESEVLKIIRFKK